MYHDRIYRSFSTDPERIPFLIMDSKCKGDAWAISGDGHQNSFELANKRAARNEISNSREKLEGWQKKFVSLRGRGDERGWEPLLLMTDSLCFMRERRSLGYSAKYRHLLRKSISCLWLEQIHQRLPRRFCRDELLIWRTLQWENLYSIESEIVL